MALARQPGILSRSLEQQAARTPEKERESGHRCGHADDKRRKKYVKIVFILSNPRMLKLNVKYQHLKLAAVRKYVGL